MYALSVFIFGIIIVSLFTLRPFVYKQASRELPSSVSPYFTAVWCLVLAVPTLPFCWQYFFVDGKPFFYSIYALSPLLKGITLYSWIKYSQVLNKESTSSNVFWGPLALAFAALVSAFIFNIPLSTNKMVIILFIGLVGVLFFVIGEGHKLTASGKKAFAVTVLAATGNILCDVVSLKYLNWYIQFIVPFVVMLTLSFAVSKKAIPVKKMFTTRYIVLAGLVFAAGEMSIIFSMQSFFPVIAAIFLIRIAQSLDIILAYHIHKEGSLKLQYFFALMTLGLSYFFYFGDSFW